MHIFFFCSVLRSIRVSNDSDLKNDEMLNKIRVFPQQYSRDIQTRLARFQISLIPIPTTVGDHTFT